MGGIEKPGQQVGDTEICLKTDAYKHHSEIRKVVRKIFPKIYRCGFLALPVEGIDCLNSLLKSSSFALISVSLTIKGSVLAGTYPPLNVPNSLTIGVGCTTLK